MIKQTTKFAPPGVGWYENEFGNMSVNKIQGGAPNNFMLMRNEKTVVPFQSKVTRFNTSDNDIHNMSIGPGTYIAADHYSSTKANSTLSKSFTTNNQSNRFFRKPNFNQEERFKDETK